MTMWVVAFPSLSLLFRDLPALLSSLKHDMYCYVVSVRKLKYKQIYYNIIILLSIMSGYIYIYNMATYNTSFFEKIKFLLKHIFVQMYTLICLFLKYSVIMHGRANLWMEWLCESVRGCPFTFINRCAIVGELLNSWCKHWLSNRNTLNIYIHLLSMLRVWSKCLTALFSLSVNSPGIVLSDMYLTMITHWIQKWPFCISNPSSSRPLSHITSFALLTTPFAKQKKA